VRGYQFLKQDAPPEYDRLVEEAKFSTQGWLWLNKWCLLVIRILKNKEGKRFGLFKN
jgi:hypothetical protein